MYLMCERKKMFHRDLVYLEPNFSYLLIQIYFTCKSHWFGDSHEMGSISLKIGDGTARFIRASLCSSAFDILMFFFVITSTTNLFALDSFFSSKFHVRNGCFLSHNTQVILKHSTFLHLKKIRMLCCNIHFYILLQLFIIHTTFLFKSQLYASLVNHFVKALL